MVIIIFILLAVLVMLLVTKPRRKMYWVRWTLIVILSGLILMLSYDFVKSLISAPSI